MPDETKETRSAEYLRGAREALTRLAEDRDRDSGRTCNGGYIRHFRDSEYSAPRVRAVVPDGWGQGGKWELYRGEWHYSGVMPLKTPVFPSMEGALRIRAALRHLNIPYEDTPNA